MDFRKVIHENVEKKYFTNIFKFYEVLFCTYCKGLLCLIKSRHYSYINFKKSSVTPKRKSSTCVQNNPFTFDWLYHINTSGLGLQTMAPNRIHNHTPKHNHLDEGMIFNTKRILSLLHAGKSRKISELSSRNALATSLALIFSSQLTYSPGKTHLKSVTFSLQLSTAS